MTPLSVVRRPDEKQLPKYNNLLMDKYFDYVQDTEAPLVFHRWTLLSALGAMLGRQYYFPFGHFKIHPNMYIMLIGNPGSRKSSAINLAKKLLAHTDYDTFAAQRTSKEKFLLDLEGVEGDDGKVIDPNAVMSNLFGDGYGTSEAKEVFICADEFNEFVGSSNLEFLSLLGSLWDWDDPTTSFKQRLKTSRSVSIYQPTISILGGNTHAGFTEAFPPQSIGQGFLSRLLLVYGEPSGKKITFPKPPSDAMENELIRLLGDIKNTVHGSATMTKQAEGMLETIYRTFPGLPDARFEHYSTRRFSHLLKLCLLTSASNLRTEIIAEDVLFANTLLSFTEHRMPQAMGEFGKAKNADIAARIVAILNTAKTPIDMPELWKQCQSDLDRPEDLNKLLAGLLQGGKIQWIAKGYNGVQGYLPVKRLLNNSNVYVDFNLLVEAKSLLT
jgi:hypothetical protein